MEKIFTLSRIKQLFPKVESKYLRYRLKFCYHVAYINYWEEWEDCLIFLRKYNIDFEKLYQNYRNTRLVPYFDNLVISFVKNIEYFISTNRSIMFIVQEDLLIRWK